MGLCSFLRTGPSVTAAAGRDANGTEQVVLKENLSIGGVVEERNDYHNVGDNTNDKVPKRSSGKSSVMSALAKRLGNPVLLLFSTYFFFASPRVVGGLWFSTPVVQALNEL